MADRALDTNVAPEFPAAAVEFDLLENALPGANVGTVRATDAENDPIAYSLTDDNNKVFVIDQVTGQIKVAPRDLNERGFDFEQLSPATSRP